MTGGITFIARSCCDEFKKLIVPIAFFWIYYIDWVLCRFSQGLVTMFLMSKLRGCHGAVSYFSSTLLKLKSTEVTKKTAFKFTTKPRPIKANIGAHFTIQFTFHPPFCRRHITHQLNITCKQAVSCREFQQHYQWYVYDWKNMTLSTLGFNTLWRYFKTDANYMLFWLEWM